MEPRARDGVVGFFTSSSYSPAFHNDLQMTDNR